MQKIECYECEQCGAVYNLEEEAISCEKSHRAKEVFKVQDVKYQKGDECDFPEFILVEIDEYSGVLAEYKKVEENSFEDFFEEDRYNCWNRKLVND